MTEPVKPKLWAVAAERMVKINGRIDHWIPEIIHLHATDRLNAQYVFMQDSIHRTQYRIVAIGPVIGYHVEDEHGEVLRA